MSELIYLDYNASTPIAPEVQEAMAFYLRGAFGNPSSEHWAGRPAREGIDQAREQVAGLIGAASEEITFTSGGTEANNLAIQGTWLALGRRKEAHVVTTAVEHPATLEACRLLEQLGATLTVLPVDPTGRVDPEAVERAITPRTILISVMHANNEVGTLQPVEEIGRIARRHGVRLHVDAAQSAGKVPVNVDDLQADLVSLAGHKMYAPKGVGALYRRTGLPLAPLIRGGGQEGGLRAGTESALLAVAMGQACQMVQEPGVMERVGDLRDELWEGLHRQLGDRVMLNGHPEQRLPNTLNCSFHGCSGSAVLAKCPRIAASTGSACHAGDPEASVLGAMGLSPERARGAVRLSLGRHTQREEIRVATEALAAAAQR